MKPFDYHLNYDIVSFRAGCTFRIMSVGLKRANHKTQSEKIKTVKMADYYITNKATP